jgi:hypothetical protein
MPRNIYCLHLLKSAVLMSCLILLTPVTIAAENAAEAYGPDLKKLPDWTGVWGLTGGLLFPGNENSVFLDDPGGGEGFTYGPLPGSYITGVPYNDEYQKKYDEIVRKAREEFIVDDPISGCQLPHGMPRAVGSVPGNVELIITPQQTTIIYGWMNQARRIYTDGRPHPSEDESWPMVMGHSIGHWEGHTLVVDTINMRESVFDRSGAPHSEAITLQERITRIDDDTLAFEMILTDPLAFTEPWELTRYYKKRQQAQINVEGIYCENQRNPIIDGKQTVILPGDTN